MNAKHENDLNANIATWRSFIEKRQAISAEDADELEANLRDRIDDLSSRGLDEDESFLVAVKRMGSTDAVSREFAREHSDRLWKHLLGDDGGREHPRNSRSLAIITALVAAVLIKLPTLLGMSFEQVVTIGPVLLLTPVAVYVLLQRNATVRLAAATLAPFATVLALLLVYPFPASEPGMTQILAVLHSVVVLWLAIGIAYTNGAWRSPSARMDFVRFTGEWAIYVLLILIGGVLLTGVATAAFMAVGIDVFNTVVPDWIAPCGTAAAFVIGAWLVEEKQSVIENIAPVMTRIFTPLFTAVLVLLVVAAFAQRNFIDGSRELLIVFDLVLLVVLGLLLYTMSSRDPQRAAGWFEWMQLAMVIAAIIVDLLVLSAMIGRIGEYGVSANKLASLGINVILLVNLSGSAWGLIRFLRGKAPFAALERWQTGFAPVYLIWAAIVVVVFPPIFGFA